MSHVELQKAIYSKLSTSLVIPVYDHVPQGSEYPYIVIGEDTAIEWDTDDSVGSESTLTLHVWTRNRGRKECKEIMDSIYDVLHRCELAVTGYNVVNCAWELAETFVDPDGKTRHGVTRYRIIMDREVL
jgi:hypothetical protein